MNAGQRLARLATGAVVSTPWLWRAFRGPLRSHFDHLAPRWDEIVGPGHLDAVRAALAEVPPPRRALDLGTGTGAAAFLLAERYPEAEIVGVDLAPEMVAAAEAKIPAALAGRVRFLEADAAALPLPTDSCQLVVLANMIPFFDEIGRVLAAEGTLLAGFSRGAATPIYVPPRRLRAELEGRGFVHFADFAAGPGTCLLARRA
ncbi:MAG TPA: class I SAM-dependent methyltransferase [Gaiellaceae bacterium]|nr:class I SAM-dependent methyltransferase [Gaiellaceae bacterium]